MDISDLSLVKSAQFFKITKPISKVAIKRAFTELSSNSIGKAKSKRYRVSYTSSIGNIINYSFLSFEFESEPAFLASTNYRETKYAYLLLIECSDAVIVFKRHIDQIDRFFSNFIDDYSYEQLIHFYGNRQPEYERIAMRNMSISNAVVRSRALEAKSLNGIVSSSSSGRSIPSSFRMNVSGQTYTVTPNVARISQRDRKVGFDDAVDWSIEMKNEINSTVIESDFIGNFAAPVSLSDIVARGHDVTAILLDLSEIEDGLEQGRYSMSRSTEEGEVLLMGNDLNRLFSILRAPVVIENGVSRIKGRVFGGAIRLNKNVITIVSSILRDLVVNQPGKESFTLESFLNKYKPFSAVFDSPQYSYYSKSCFEDKSIKASITSVLNIFNDSVNFGEIVSEKEKPHKSTISRFPSTSLFRSIEDNYCNGSDIVICDDMNDEWADHIIINYTKGMPSIEFIHSKYVSKESYGASKFHDVVAQALKNIGRVHSDKIAFKKKYDNEWCKTYESTRIARVAGDKKWPDIEQALDAIYENPNSVKKVVLATPFLSKGKLKVELNKLAAGRKCQPHYIQLVWLLNTFISSCKEAGVQAYVLCKK